MLCDVNFANYWNVIERFIKNWVNINRLVESIIEITREMIIFSEKSFLLFGCINGQEYFTTMMLRSQISRRLDRRVDNNF